MSSKIAILSFLFAFANAAILSNPTSRIFGGEDAEVGEFPYLASLSSKGHIHDCGGNIIDEKWILTAAHCIDDNMVVRAGKHQLGIVEDYEQLIEVESTHQHASWGTSGLEFDIALIKLKMPLKLNKRVAIIALPKAGAEPDSPVMLAGWGVTQALNATGILQKVKLPILERKMCNESLINLESVALRDNMVCTASEGSGHGACFADSGSGLIQRINGVNQIVGLTSWTVPPCGYPGHPTVYTKISDFVDWIYTVIKYNSE